MRSVVAGIGLVSVIGAMILGSYVVVKAMGAELSGGPAAGDEASSLVLRISGTPGTSFSGTYTTDEGSQSVSGVLGTAPATTSSQATASRA
jgi:hypothetical protein